MDSVFYYKGWENFVVFNAQFIQMFVEAPIPKRSWAKKLGLAQTPLYGKTKG